MNSISHPLYVRVLNDHQGYFVKSKPDADDGDPVASISTELPTGVFDTSLGATQVTTTRVAKSALIDLVLDGELRAVGAVVWDENCADEIWSVLLRTHQNSLLACTMPAMPLPPPPPPTPWLVITFTPLLFAEWDEKNRMLALSLFCAAANNVHQQQLVALN